MLQAFVASLNNISCDKQYSKGEDTSYVSKVYSSKKKFLCTLTIVNPESKHVSIGSSKKGEVTFHITGGHYQFTVGTSKAGLPKLVATATTLSPNSTFVTVTAPNKNALILPPDPCEGLGFIAPSVNEVSSKFVGVLLIGSNVVFK